MNKPVDGKGVKPYKVVINANSDIVSEKMRYALCFEGGVYHNAILTLGGLSERSIVRILKIR